MNKYGKLKGIGSRCSISVFYFRLTTYKNLSQVSDYPAKDLGPSEYKSFQDVLFIYIYVEN
jgi:hypothetical protein